MKTTDILGRPLKSGQKSVLGKRFRWPPFSVLNTRDGDWQRRKREWISIGIKSELGRGESLTWDDGVKDIDEYRHREAGLKDGGSSRAKAQFMHPNGKNPSIADQKNYRESLKKRAKAQSYRMDQYIDDYRPKKANAVPSGSKRPLSRGYTKTLTDKQNQDAADDIRRRNGVANATPGGSLMPSMSYSKDKARGDGRGRPIFHAQPGGGPSKKSVWLGSAGKPVGGSGAINAVEDSEDSQVAQSGTSIFDPVLCELFYRWFTPATGTILDPFAGGSVRGIVANLLGRSYTGIDLRPEQVAANKEQALSICSDNSPNWIIGDSRNVKKLVSTNFEADAVFSCPPYFDLELYSDDDRDLSNSSWNEFCDSYFKIIKRSTSFLKDNRFAAFVVGDVRDKKGRYRDLRSETVQCFVDAGLDFYNEIVLVTAVGSLPLRIHAQFAGSRKVGRSHQYMLVFVKGDPKIAAAACEPIDLISNDMAFRKPPQQKEERERVRL